MKIGGIDPGVSGGVSRYDGKKVELHKMPDTLQGICTCVEGLDHVYIEEVHAIFGSSAGATFQFGRMFQLVQDACECSGIPYTLVQPKKRQGKLYEESDIVYKSIEPRKVKDTKATSLNCANRIFKVTDEFWRDSNRQKKAQDGLYDSALICYYGYNDYTKKT